ncbi:acyl-CoA N-acyltransferase, partial [Pavlovales sp. CCMP2436]
MRYRPHTPAARVPLSAFAPQLAGVALELRRLSVADFGRGALGLLAQLTTVGEVSEAAFVAFVERASADDTMAAFALVDGACDGALVGVGTLLLVPVALRPGEGRLRAHIEDIVIDERARGRGLGALLIRALTDAASAAGAETVVLECSPKNVGFYAKLGYVSASSSMARYF